MTKSILPTKRQVIAFLKDSIELRRELRWPDDSTINAIRCLEMALQIVKEWKQPKPKRTAR